MCLCEHAMKFGLRLEMDEMDMEGLVSKINKMAREVSIQLHGRAPS